MKKFLVITVIAASFLGANIDRVDFATLENSQIKTINNEKVVGLEVNERYRDYTNSVDFYTNEDSGIVIFYKDDLSDIKFVNNL